MFFEAFRHHLIWKDKMKKKISKKISKKNNFEMAAYLFRSTSFRKGTTRKK